MWGKGKMQQLIEKTVGQIVSENADMYGEREMIKYTDRDYSRSFKAFDEETDVIARAFMALGVEKGDHIAIWDNNTPAWLLTLFASAKVGAVLVTVNTNYKIFELEYLLRQSDTKVLVMGAGNKNSSYPEIVNALCPTLRYTRVGEYADAALPRLETVIYADGEAPGMLAFERLYDIAETVTQGELEERKSTLCSDDVVNMQYTSGTTGFPKGVMLTHKNIINNGFFIGESMRFTKEDRLCICVPFFHCFGLVLATMASLTHGCSIVPIDHFRPDTVLDALEKEHCTAVHGVPTMFISMLAHESFKSRSFPRLRTGIMAGSPCPVKVMEQVVNEMGMKEITIAYGQTEASPVCTQTTTEDSVERRVATVGRALPFTETKIVDPETGLGVPDGVSGEFCARGYNIMKGYYRMPEATRQAIDADGWLHTGDLATRDEKGYYKIVGRIKDMIIRGGENVYPKEIEEFLYTHPSVSDVQVIGVPDRQYGEEIMACVVLKPGERLTQDEVKDFVRASMAKHKVPRYVEFMDSFPMTASGKIQKFKLRDWAVDKLGLRDDADIETA